MGRTVYLPTTIKIHEIHVGKFIQFIPFVVMDGGKWEHSSLWWNSFTAFGSWKMDGLGLKPDHSAGRWELGLFSTRFVLVFRDKRSTWNLKANQFLNGMELIELSDFTMSDSTFMRLSLNLQILTHFHAVIWNSPTLFFEFSEKIHVGFIWTLHWRGCWIWSPGIALCRRGYTPLCYRVYEISHYRNPLKKQPGFNGKDSL